MSMRALVAGDARPVLLVLLGAVGVVLLLVGANVAGLGLARAASRRREIAVRTALGAGRGRILRQLLTESLLLALAGGALGVLVALWGAELLVELFPRNVSNLHMPIVAHIPLDGRVLGFALAATLAAGLLAGALPAIQGSRTDLGRALKEGDHGSRPSRLRPVLAAAQVGLALVLSVGAGLLVRSALLRAHALGFDPAHVLTGRVLVDAERVKEPERQRQILAQILERLRAAPGVASAGSVSLLPLCGWSSATTFFDPRSPGEEREAAALFAEPGYFATLRIPLLAGRLFGPADDGAAPTAIVVDQRFVRRFLAGRDPIGARLDFGTAAEPDWRQIVGVVGDVENEPPPAAQRPTVYIPYARDDFPVYGLVVRGAGDPLALAGAMREAVGAADPEQPLSYLMSADALVGDALAVHRTSMWLLGFFAVVALALAAMGIYGVLAQSVLERRREIGIRIALGAPRRHVVGVVARRLATMTGAGVAVGLAGALAGGRLLGALLYGVSPSDPALLAWVVVLLGAVAVLAALAPLARALRTDPLRALHDE
jgi:putative ABC transport system permease protein